MGSYKPPKSIHELAQEANGYKFTTNFTYTTWLRSAHTVYKTAQLHEKNKAYPEAYVFYLRFLDLILNKIPTHPDFQDRSSYRILSGKARGVMSHTEKLKTLIEREIQEYEAQRKVRHKTATEKNELPKPAETTEDTEDTEDADRVLNEKESVQFKRNFSDLSTNTGPSIAVDNINNEKTDTNGKIGSNVADKINTNGNTSVPYLNFGDIPNLNAGIAEQTLVKQDGLFNPKIQLNAIYNDPPYFSNGNGEAGTQFDEIIDDTSDDDESSIVVPDYPTIADEPSLIKMYKPKVSTVTAPELHPQEPPNELSPSQNNMTLTPKVANITEETGFSHSPITIASPQRPPKIKSVEQIRSFHESSEGHPSNDDLKGSFNNNNNNTSYFSAETSESQHPPQEEKKISENILPQHLTQEETFTEGGIPLKTVMVPAEIQSRFTSIAAPNTERNLETCGILCGKLVSDAFIITDLVIPDQNSTQNTCQTINEENLLQFVDQNDLFILGWIHTHPTQSCFLSSVDLHTQNGYQIMLPESIAIVVAPKSNPNFGIFRLSDPYGISLITRCIKRGFHPHSEDGVYDICSRNNGGHVLVTRNIPLDVTDIRTK